MRPLYLLSAFFLLFFSSNTHAQLTNGTQTLGGFGGIRMGFYKNKQTTSTQFSYSNYIGFSPTYAYFKNKFLIGATVGSGIDWSRYKNDDALNPSTLSYHTFTYNFNPYLRYYTVNNSKYAHFAFADINLYGTLSNRTFQIGNNFVKVNDPFNFTWKAGIGGHKVLNKNFVAEGVLYYGSEGNIAFQANLRHFYTSFDKKNQEAPPQYIAKNRWQVAASFSANNNFNDKTNYVGFYLLGGKMLDNHFMLGSSLSLGFSDFSHSVDANFSLSPFVRYYIPLSSRLFVYPYISANANFDSNNYSTIRFNRGVGLQYFMTKNLALTCTTDGNFEHVKTNSYRRTTANGSLNFGFSYFVK